MGEILKDMFFSEKTGDEEREPAFLSSFLFLDTLVENIWLQHTRNYLGATHRVLTVLSGPAKPFLSQWHHIVSGNTATLWLRTIWEILTFMWEIQSHKLCTSSCISCWQRTEIQTGQTQWNKIESHLVQCKFCCLWGIAGKQVAIFNSRRDTDFSLFHLVKQTRVGLWWVGLWDPCLL